MIFAKDDGDDNRPRTGYSAGSSGMVRGDQLDLARKIALETLEEDQRALEVEARSVFR
jgi:hypothetical protein